MNLIAKVLLAPMGLCLAVSALAQERAAQLPNPGVATGPTLEPGLISGPELKMAFVPGALHLEVSALVDMAAVVLLAPSPDMQHFLVDLPPILAAGVPVGVALVHGDRPYEMKLEYLGPPITVWGQALTLIEGRVLSSAIAVAGPDPVAAQTVEKHG